MNIYLSQLVRVRGKYTFLSFSDFQTLDPWFPPKYVTVSATKYAKICHCIHYLIHGTQNMSLYLIPGPEKIQWHRTSQNTHCALLTTRREVFLYRIFMWQTNAYDILKRWKFRTKLGAYFNDGCVGRCRPLSPQWNTTRFNQHGLYFHFKSSQSSCL